MCDCMLCGVIGVCNSNDVTVMFPGRSDLARGRLCVDLILGRRLGVGNASSSSSASRLARQIIHGVLIAIALLSRMTCGSCSGGIVWSRRHLRVLTNELATVASLRFRFARGSGGYKNTHNILPFLC